ncbi:flagellar hook-length control protein FliK [Roseovarius sp. MBR-51]
MIELITRRPEIGKQAVIGFAIFRDMVKDNWRAQMFESLATEPMHSITRTPAPPMTVRGIETKSLDSTRGPLDFGEVFERIHDVTRDDISDDEATTLIESDTPELDVSLSEAMHSGRPETVSTKDILMSSSVVLDEGLQGGGVEHVLVALDDVPEFPKTHGLDGEFDERLTKYARPEAASGVNNALIVASDGGRVPVLNSLDQNLDLLFADGAISRQGVEHSVALPEAPDGLSSLNQGRDLGQIIHVNKTIDVTGRALIDPEAQIILGKTTGAATVQEMPHVVHNAHAIMQEKVIALGLTASASKSVPDDLSSRDSGLARNAYSVERVNPDVFDPTRAVAWPEIRSQLSQNHGILTDGVVVSVPNLDVELGREDPNDVMGSEFRLATSQENPSMFRNSVLWHRSELPSALAQYIATAVHQSGDGEHSVGLLLSPDEMGRIRLKLSAQDGVMTVNLLADRPETLDLLRRHIDTLARALLDVGYEHTHFSFGGQDSANGSNAKLHYRRDPAQESVQFDTASGAATIPLASPLSMHGERLDVLI